MVKELWLDYSKRRLTCVQPSLIECQKKGELKIHRIVVLAKLRAICAIGACENVPVQGFWIKLPTNKQFIFPPNSSWNLSPMHSEAAYILSSYFIKCHKKRRGTAKILSFSQLLLLGLETDTKKAVFPWEAGGSKKFIILRKCGFCFTLRWHLLIWKHICCTNYAN